MDEWIRVNEDDPLKKYKNVTFDDIKAYSTRGKLKMAKRIAKIDNRPVLYRVGSHFIDVNDVSAIKAVKKGKLYIIVLKSQPNPEYPLFVEPEEVESLLQSFNIKDND